MASQPSTSVASVPAFDPSASQSQQPIYQRQTQDISQPSATSPRPSQRPFGSSFFDSARKQESQPAPAPNFSPPSIPFASAPPMEEVFQCMTCKKTINKNVKLGDKCPHCGVTFEERVDESGKTVERSVRSTGKMIKMWVGIAILILGLIGGAIAKLRGS
jgi:hypothetical protein